MRRGLSRFRFDREIVDFGVSRKQATRIIDWNGEI